MFVSAAVFGRWVLLGIEGLILRENYKRRNQFRLPSVSFGFSFVLTGVQLPFISIVFSSGATGWGVILLDEIREMAKIPIDPSFRMVYFKVFWFWASQHHFLGSERSNWLIRSQETEKQSSIKKNGHPFQKSQRIFRNFRGKMKELKTSWKSLVQVHWKSRWPL